MGVSEEQGMILLTVYIFEEKRTGPEAHHPKGKRSYLGPEAVLRLVRQTQGACNCRYLVDLTVVIVHR